MSEARMWRQKSGTLIAVTDMSDDHLKNALAAVKSGRVNPWKHDCMVVDILDGPCFDCEERDEFRRSWMHAFSEELKRRTNKVGESDKAGPPARLTVRSPRAARKPLLSLALPEGPTLLRSPLFMYVLFDGKGESTESVSVGLEGRNMLLLAAATGDRKILEFAVIALMQQFDGTTSKPGGLRSAEVELYYDPEVEDQELVDLLHFQDSYSGVDWDSCGFAAEDDEEDALDERNAQEAAEFADAQCRNLRNDESYDPEFDEGVCSCGELLVDGKRVITHKGADHSQAGCTPTKVADEDEEGRGL